MPLPPQLEWLRRHPVTMRHPVRTWSRWLYWQVRQRLTTRPKLVTLRNHARLRVHPHEGLTGYWYVGMPDYVEMDFLARYLREDDVVYDIGANAGGFAVFAASFGCHVTAFEPIPHSFKRLEENTVLNHPGCRIEPYNLALGSAPGTLRMTAALGTGNRIAAENESGPCVSVEVTTLDEFVRSRTHPTFLKLDVEGHELEVLLGAENVLASPSLRGLLVETFRPHNWRDAKLREIEDLLERQGFLPYAYDPGGKTLIPLGKPDEGDDNTFYFRDPEQVRSRLDGAREEAGRTAREDDRGATA
jgi:FkbM family methyltransferase